RTLSPGRREAVRPALRELAEGIAAAHGCRATVTITDGFPPTVNDPRAVDLFEAVARGLRAGHFERLATPIMRGERLPYVLEHGRRGLLLRARESARGDGLPRSGPRG